MPLIKHHKYVAALPSVLEANSVYYVRTGAGYDQYVTNNAGQIVAYPANKPAASDIGAEPAIEAGTNAQYLRGDKTWQTFAAAVRSAVLTGISFTTNAAIAASDTVLTALGKLQAQITAHVGSGGDAHSAATTGAAGFMSAADKTKLNGVDSGATANSSDASLRNRANHTGTQTLATISDAGTAAVENAQANATDATANVLARVGAFGQVGAANAPSVTGDLDNVVLSGNYYATAVTNGPAGTAGTWLLEVIGATAGSGRCSQRAIRVGASAYQVFARVMLLGAWQPWVELWSSSASGWGATAPVTITLSNAGAPLTLNAVSAVAMAINRTNAAGNVGISFTSSTFTRYFGFATGGVLKVSNAADLSTGSDIWHAGNFDPANYSTTAQMQAAIIAANTGIPVTTFSNAAYTIALSYFASGAPYIRMTNSSAATITVPANSAQAIPIGAEITLRRAANANLTVVAASGVTVNPPAGGTLVMTQNMTATLKKVAINEWDLIGQTVAA